MVRHVARSARRVARLPVALLGDVEGGTSRVHAEMGMLEGYVSNFRSVSAGANYIEINNITHKLAPMPRL